MWGRKGLQVFQGKEAWSWREERERERASKGKKTVHSRLHKENSSSKQLTGKIRGADYLECLKPAKVKTGILELCTVGGLEPGRCCSSPVKEGSGQGVHGMI